MISTILFTKIRYLFMEEVRNDDEMALVLFDDMSKRVGIEATNLVSIQSDADARRVIDEFHKYKIEMTDVESYPITSEEESQWTWNK